MQEYFMVNLRINEMNENKHFRDNKKSIKASQESPLQIASRFIAAMHRSPSQIEIKNFQQIRSVFHCTGEVFIETNFWDKKNARGSKIDCVIY
jgi:hypothetical protein